MAYELRPDAAQPAAAVALWYRAPASGFGPKPQPGLARLAAATVAGSAPITGTPLGRLVERYGGRLRVAAYPDSVSISALVPPDRVAQTVRAMTADYFAPVVGASGLELARRDVGEDAFDRSLDPEQALEDALGSALFASGPLHDGLIGTPADYAGASLAQVRAFAERAFRPANAVLVLTGAVDAAALSAVATREGAPAGAEPPVAQVPQPPPAPLNRRGNAAGIGLGWVGPPIADDASATALDFVADALFAPGTGTVAKAIGNRKASVSGRFVTYHDPGVFLVDDLRRGRRRGAAAGGPGDRRRRQAAERPGLRRRPRRLRLPDPGRPGDALGHGRHLRLVHRRGRPGVRPGRGRRALLQPRRRADAGRGRAGRRALSGPGAGRRDAGRSAAPATRHEENHDLMRTTLITAALALALAGPAAAAPATTAVDLGGARGYVQADPGAPLAAVQLFVRAGLDRQTGAQSGLAALTAEAVLRTPVEGAPLVEAVAARGGSLDYAVAVRGVRFTLEAPPEALAGLAALVARALAAPADDAATLAAARGALGERIAEDEHNPIAVGQAMLRASYYREEAGLPALGTPGSLSALGPADVRAFHQRWYVRDAASLTEVGRTGPAVDAAARALAAALPAGSAAPPPALATRPFLNQPRQLVTSRDIGVSFAVLGFAAPPLGDRDFPAALVLRALLGDVLDHPSATSLPIQQREVGLIYGYDVAPAQLVLWIDGRLLDPATGLGTVAAVTKAAAGKPLAAAVLGRYKEAARGQWQLEALSLEERAASIDNAAALGLDPAALDAIPAAVDAVSAADVQRVAKRWFQKFDVALVLPRRSGG